MIVHYRQNKSLIDEFFMPEKIRITRKELYEQVWAEPMTRLAKKYGVSDVGLRKRCLKLNIPVPSIGYWQKKEFGKAAQPPPLQPFEGHEDIVFHIELEKENNRPIDEKQYKEAEEKIAFERDEKNRIHVSSILRAPHPLVAQTLEYFENLEPSRFRSDKGLLNGYGDKCLNMRVSKESLPRALRIMNALIKACDARGFHISVVAEDQYAYRKSYKTCVSVLGETIEFGLREFLKQTKRKLSSAERKDRPWANEFEFSHNPSGRLTFEIKTWGCLRTNWADSEKKKLEECLNDFIVGLIKNAVELRTRAIEREQEARRREEQQRRQEEIARRKREEEARLQNLLNQTENWHRSKQIREYIQAVKDDAIRKNGCIEPGSELDKWLTWANQQADRFDPLLESRPLIPDKDE